MQSIIQNNLHQIIGLSKAHKVERLHLFGSACTDKFNAESDIDLLVKFGDVPLEEYADNYFDLKEALEELLDREVELVSEETLSNPYFIKSVEKNRIHLYG